MSRLEELINELCPDGVEYKKLGDLGNFFGGITGKSKDDFKDGNAKFITYKNVYCNPALDIEVDDRVKIDINENQRTLEYGDVIFTGSSETPDECGISSVLTAHTSEKLYLNSFCFFFRFNDLSIMLPNFAKHLFRSNDLRKQIGRTASGVTRYNVSKKLMENIVIPIPPLQVQEEIVRILDNFTELTNELTNELEFRKKQYEWYRDELFNFKYPIQNTELGNVLKSLKTGLNPRKFFQLNTGDATNHYVTIREIQNNKIIFNRNTDKINDKALELCNNRSNLEVGDVLFSGTGTIGATALILNKPTNWNIKEGVYSLKPDENKILPKFLMYILQTKDVKKSIHNKVVGGTVKSIPMRDLEKINISLPSLQEQQRIVDILDKFDAYCNDLTQGLPAEIELRKKQYEYYRDKLLTFKRLEEK